MKQIFYLILFSTIGLHAQKDIFLKKTALRDAQIVCEASLKQNTQKILQYTHPAIIKKLGRVKTMQIIDEVFGLMGAQNITILDSKANDITEIKKEKGQFRCLVTNTIKMDINGRLMTVNSSLFGFYNKKDQKWSFIESSKLFNDPETMEIFPNFKTSIIIPDEEYQEG